MELLQFYYFIKIAEHGSISKAANELYVTQPALSKMLQRIEKEVGYTLIDRNTKEFQLNEYGQCFLEYAQKIVRNVTDIPTALDEVDGKLKRNLSISSSNTSLIYKWIAKYIVTYPNINVQHHVFNNEQSVIRLLSGDIDFALTIGPLIHEDIEFEPLWDDRFVLSTFEGNCLCDITQGYMIEFKERPFVSLPSNNNHLLYINYLSNLAGFKPKIIFEAELDILMQLQEQIPAYVVGLEKADDFLLRNNSRFIKLLDPFAHCTIYMNWVKDKQYNCLGNTLRQFLKNEFTCL